MEDIAMDDFSMACLREVAELDRKLEHTRYWYGQRIERLSKWAREELDEPLRTRFFSIVVNGTPDVMEPPTSAQNYNGMKARAEKAESELVRLRAAGVLAADPPILNCGKCEDRQECASGCVRHAAAQEAAGGVRAPHPAHCQTCGACPPQHHSGCTAGVKGPEHG
jgi:hypothetical protein